MANAGKRVLITGISKGIGKATAVALSKEGYDVFGTCREPDSVPREKKIPGVKYLPLDVTDPGSVNRLAKKTGHVDVLINNAGGSQIGSVEEAPVSLVRYLFELNLLGVIYLTQKFLPTMRERGSGFIINISSLAGRLGVPFSSIYSATKHGLDGYAKGLRSEVKRFGVRVVNVCPYGIASGISPQKHYGEDSPYYGMISEILRIRAGASSRAPEPEVVASLVSKILGMRNPRFSYVVGGMAPLLALLYKILPERAAEIIQRKVFRLDR
jgi:short-subunit dehydrogenase